MDGLFHGKPYEQMDDFWKHPYIYIYINIMISTSSSTPVVCFIRWDPPGAGRSPKDGGGGGNSGGSNPAPLGCDMVMSPPRNLFFLGYSVLLFEVERV